MVRAADKISTEIISVSRCVWILCEVFAAVVGCCLFFGGSDAAALPFIAMGVLRGLILISSVIWLSVWVLSAVMTKRDRLHSAYESNSFTIRGKR